MTDQPKRIALNLEAGSEVALPTSAGVSAWHGFPIPTPDGSTPLALVFFGQVVTLHPDGDGGLVGEVDNDQQLPPIMLTRTTAAILVAEILEAASRLGNADVIAMMALIDQEQRHVRDRYEKHGESG